MGKRIKSKPKREERKMKKCIKRERYVLKRDAKERGGEGWRE